MTQRFLVMGDNHRDAGSLRRVLADIEDDPVDAAIHVGDVTKAWRTSRRHDDGRLGKERGVG
jgi:predicted phosphodiesterase